MKATLFVLLPERLDEQTLLADAPSRLRAQVAAMRWRRFPPVDAAHPLAVRVHAVHDPVALTQAAGMVAAIVAGAAIGIVTNLALAHWLGTFGGLLDVAATTGAAGGAFFGGLSAAMRGTARLRPEVEALVPAATHGDALVAWTGADVDAVRALARHCEQHRLACRVRHH